MCARQNLDPRVLLNSVVTFVLGRVDQTKIKSLQSQEGIASSLCYYSRLYDCTVGLPLVAFGTAVFGCTCTALLQ